MRTTVTLDDDVVALVQQRMKQRGVSFKAALNDAVRDSAQSLPTVTEFTTRTMDLGVPSINLDRALQVVADLEDDELIRRQRRGA